MVSLLSWRAGQAPADANRNRAIRRTSIVVVDTMPPEVKLNEPKVACQRHKRSGRAGRYQLDGHR